jgi:hypothetical protein
MPAGDYFIAYKAGFGKDGFNQEFKHFKQVLCRGGR